MILFVAILFEVCEVSSEKSTSLAFLELPLSSVAGASRAYWSSDETTQDLGVFSFGTSVLSSLFSESYRFVR